MKEKVKTWQCRYSIKGEYIDFEAMRKSEDIWPGDLQKALSSDLRPFIKMGLTQARQALDRARPGSREAYQLIVTIALHKYVTDDKEVATVYDYNYGTRSERVMIPIHQESDRRLRNGHGNNSTDLLAIKRARSR